MRFTKMQGVGNDFVILNTDSFAVEPDFPALAITLCDRHFGVGADGLLTVSQQAMIAPPGAFSMRMFNPDGTEDMCGNGLRCAALWALRSGWLRGQTEFMAMTKDGARSMRIISATEGGPLGILGADMGAPRFAPNELPFADDLVSVVFDYPLQVDDCTFLISTLYTGSTHTVIFGDTVDEATFQRYSPLIENHPLFPERTTVLWATIRDKSIVDVRIWERGVGETLGCGTGACAVAVSAIQHGFAAAREPVDIVSRGGTLRVAWSAPEGAMDLIGPASIVFEGDFPIAA